MAVEVCHTAPLSKVKGMTGHPHGRTTLKEHVAFIRGPQLAQHQATARRHLESGQRDRYDAHKDTGPAVVFAGYYPGGRRRQVDPIEHSRLVFCETDKLASVEEASAERDRLARLPFVAAAYVSLSGLGVHVVVALDDAPAGEDGKALNFDHRRAWEVATEALGLDAETNDASVKNVNRITYASHDPDAYLASEITPLRWNLLLDKAAMSEIPPPDDYNDWLGWLGTFKALGFTPDEVDAWSRQGERYEEGEIEGRWDGLPDDNPADARRKLRGYVANQRRGVGPRARVKLVGPDAQTNAVVLCEGQTAAAALRRYAIPDVTPAYWHGAGADAGDFSPLKGRHVILWPDTGPAGRGVMDTAAERLRNLAANVKIVDVSALTDRQNAADIDREGAVGILNSAAPYPFGSPELWTWIHSKQAGDDTRTAEALLRQCGDRLMMLTYVVKDKHSLARKETSTYYLRDNGLWEENSPALRAELQALLNRLKLESWGLPPTTPHVGGNAVRAQLKRLSDNPDKVIKQTPTVAKLWQREGSAEVDKVTFAEERDLDKDGRYLGTASGVVDLQTADLLSPADARRHLVTRSTGVRFVKGARHSDVDKITSHLPPEIEAYLWACLGRALWADPTKMFVLLVGPVNGGKSTLFNALGRALGMEGGTFSRDAIRPSRSEHGKDGPTPERAPFVEKRIIWALEAEGWYFDGAKTKMFSGGEGLIPHQPKFRPQEDYPLRATMFVAANEYPAMDLDSEGVAERLRIVAFPKPKKLDGGMLNRVKKGVPQAEATLLRLIEAAAASPPERELVVPDVMQEIINNRVAQAVGDFGLWLNAAFRQRSSQRVSTEDIWAAWAAFNGEDPDKKRIAEVSRSKDLTSRIFKMKAVQPRQLWIDGKKHRGYEGWDLVEAEHCSQCRKICPSSDLVDLDGRGGVCSECRGDGATQGRMDTGSEPHLLEHVEARLAELELRAQRIGVGEHRHGLYELIDWSMLGVCRGLAAALRENPAAMPPQVVAHFGGPVAMLKSIEAYLERDGARNGSYGTAAEHAKFVAAAPWPEFLQAKRQAYAEAVARERERNSQQIVALFKGLERP